MSCKDAYIWVLECDCIQSHFYLMICSQRQLDIYIVIRKSRESGEGERQRGAPVHDCARQKYMWCMIWIEAT